MEDERDSGARLPRVDHPLVVLRRGAHGMASEIGIQ
jgi:hypothetical protein